MSLPKKARWILREPDPEQLLSVAGQSPELPALLQRLLALLGTRMSVLQAGLVILDPDGGVAHPPVHLAQFHP